MFFPSPVKVTLKGAESLNCCYRPCYMLISAERSFIRGCPTSPPSLVYTPPPHSSTMVHICYCCTKNSVHKNSTNDPFGCTWRIISHVTLSVSSMCYFMEFQSNFNASSHITVTKQQHGLLMEWSVNNICGSPMTESRMENSFPSYR